MHTNTRQRQHSTHHFVRCAVSASVCMVCVWYVCMYRRESHTLFLAYAQPTNRYSHACGAHPIERAHTHTRRTMKQTTNQRGRDGTGLTLGCTAAPCLVCVCVCASPRRPLCLLSSSCVVIIIVVVVVDNNNNNNNNNNNSNNDDDNSNKGGRGQHNTTTTTTSKGELPLVGEGAEPRSKNSGPKRQWTAVLGVLFFFSRPGPVPLYILSDGPASLGARKVLRPVYGFAGQLPHARVLTATVLLLTTYYLLLTTYLLTYYYYSAPWAPTVKPPSTKQKPHHKQPNI